MIQILFNPDHPELVFSIANFLMGINKEHYSQKYVIMPFKPKELNKDLAAVQNELDKQLLKVIGNKHFDGQANSERNQYVLFGICPQDEVDAKEIAFFFDKNVDDILIWVDGHVWPDNLLAFLYSQSKNILIDHTRSCLKNLERKQSIKEEWLVAEEAMAQKNLSHPLAARYLKSFLTLKHLQEFDDDNDQAETFVLFHSIVVELVSGKENLGLTAGEVVFDDNLQKISNYADKFSDCHPIFAEAKKRGRSVGCLVLNQVENYFDAWSTLNQGLERFPWLCILGYQIGETSYVVFKSRHLPIQGTVRTPTLAGQSFIKLLKKLSEDVLKL